MTTTTQALWQCCTAPFRRARQQTPVPRVAADDPAADVRPAPPSKLRPSDRGSPVEALLAQERYCLLLRPQLAGSLTVEQCARAREALERSMAQIPAGPVDLRQNEQQETDSDALEQVEPLLLDRYPVTNRRFKQFIEAGAYDTQTLWDAEIWPMVGEFRDAGGVAGPRYWRSGRYPSGEEDHPVVGVNWYEAAAYARWAGKRLPTETEWVRAAACPIQSADGKLTQRRFPWGDAMDRGRCNVWGSGPSRAVAVTQFSAGVSVGGVYQLIGNVWEWQSGDFGAVDVDGRPLELPGPMKSIRGGAFDTYFEHQACCSFASGENPLARKHNIGFRGALSLCDVASLETRNA
ncbi:MAG TPA: SUMF1/EgtB/PvdO family nonheme iron enzyme [Pirellulales bacterium]|nr:SUMF1/EgtB/PvdO family nonheme iron enzyme [Pirellulales bacterium]